MITLALSLLTESDVSPLGADNGVVPISLSPSSGLTHSAPLSLPLHGLVIEPNAAVVATISVADFHALTNALSCVTVYVSPDSVPPFSGMISVTLATIFSSSPALTVAVPD